MMKCFESFESAMLINNVLDLYELCCDYKNKHRKFNLIFSESEGGCFVPLGISYETYIEAGVLYLYATQKDVREANGKDMKMFIEKEAMDSCWNVLGINAHNIFGDCEINIIVDNGENNTYYEIVVALVCEDEINLICKKIN